MPTTLKMGDILNCPYTGNKVSITLPAGRYYLECWGAQGGYRSSTEYGGKGGYSKGVLTLEEATDVFLYAGGKGGSSSSTSNQVYAGGFNGGGYRYGCCGGGGASDIRIGTDSLYARIIVAGGGGSDGNAAKGGGAGGGISGQETPASNYGTGGLGGQSTYSGTSTSTTATTQATSGLDTSSISLTYGGFGFGGAGLYVNSGYGGAGGGGWYGGQGTLPDSSTDDNKGGGGGSGFVYTKETVSSVPIGYLLSGQYYLTQSETKQGTTSFISPNNVTETGHSGDGYVRITVGENMNDLRRRKSARIQQKGSSSTEWDPDTILLSREIGIETDTNKIKIGDGVTPWSLLPYCNTSASDEEIIGQKTTESGEIFNDYTNNKAFSYSHAEGNNTSAGHKAFSFAPHDYTEADYTDKENKIGKYYLNTINDIVTNINYSIMLENNYNYQGKVISIGDNYIEVNNYLLPNSDAVTTLSEKSYIIFPDNPEIQGDKIIGVAAHSEGFNTNAMATYSHAEGGNTKSSAKYSHSEGRESIAGGYASHAENNNNKAIGHASHAEGSGTIASGAHSHTEGLHTIASAYAAHAEGDGNKANGNASHSEGKNNTSQGHCSHTEGESNSANDGCSHAEGKNNTSYGEAAHIEGIENETHGEGTHAEGINTKANGRASHTEGIETGTDMDGGHAEGYKTRVGNKYAHAEGNNTIAMGESSHSEGSNTKASGGGSHAEGIGTNASGYASHAEGDGTKSAGVRSHAEGMNTQSKGYVSHTEGIGTVAEGVYQHVQGKYNKPDTTSAHIVGNGKGANNLSNAHTLDWSGNAWFAGDVRVGGTYNSDAGIVGAKTLATIDEVRPKVRLSINGTANVNTIYDLLVQTQLNITLPPSGQIGDFIEFNFISGETATSLTVNSSSGLIGFDLIPEKNTIYTLYFDWGIAGYNGTVFTYGWRCNYSEYSTTI